MPPEYVTSSENKQQLLKKGFIYDKERTREDRIYWKCKKYFTGLCQGRAVTRNGAIVHENSKHNYLPRGGRVGAAKIIGEATGRIPELVQAALPSVPAILKTTQRIWKRTNPALSELVIDGPYLKTSSGEDFLLFDSGAGGPNQILFSTERNLEVLSSSDHWFCDGIFKTAPSLFTQPMTIHAIKFDAVIPLITGSGAYEGALADLSKTNDYIEGWHKKFSSLVGCYHLSI
ncbi:hypothetical protein ILUMI_20606 [Ignelater luminosus]|uniref:FLYWCH-type domain-containing protein n=1 Tax=Ignelater luminosus TaxID=2038154 RepID=A0A8K0G4N8_IGNLU|nr:hypothetical protein ILUMI_20606 [Ignelater luminosus]